MKPDSAAVMPLRVALVTETFPPEVNGVAMTLARMVDGLRRRGHRVQLVRPRQRGEATPGHGDDDGGGGGGGGGGEILVPGIPIPWYRSMRFGLPAKRRLTAVWQSFRPDVVHIATEGPLGNSALAAACALGIPVSTGFHTNFDSYTRHYRMGLLRGPIRAWLRRFHNRADVTLVPSASLAGELEQTGFRNVELLACGVDTAQFDPARRSAEMRRGWGLADGGLAVAYVGRLAAEKNLDLLVKTCEHIRSTRPDARVVLVGDGPLRGGLGARLPDAVFAGIHQGDDLAAHYASADLFLFPSLTETFGNVVTEALASGLAVVAFDHAAAGTLIANDVNGLLVPADEPDAFARRAVELAGDDERIGRLRAAARPSVLHLDWERIHDEFAAILRKLIARQREPRHAQDTVAPAQNG